jgi:hypothetical protein
MIAEHPDNPKIFIYTGDPCLTFREPVLLPAHQMIHGGPEHAVSFFKKEGNPVSRFPEQTSPAMGHGRFPLKFSGLIRDGIASGQFDQRRGAVIQCGIL